MEKNEPGSFGLIGGIRRQPGSRRTEEAREIVDRQALSTKQTEACSKAAKEKFYTKDRATETKEQNARSRCRMDGSLFRAGSRMGLLDTGRRFNNLEGRKIPCASRGIPAL